MGFSHRALIHLRERAYVTVSKAGLREFVCGLAIELLAENFSLNDFAPGAINIERSTLSVPVLPVS